MTADKTTLRGERVTLRPLQEDDIEESLRVWTPELRYMYGGSLAALAGPIESRRAGKRAWVERVRRGEEGHCFSIETDGRYIGHVRVRLDDRENWKGHYAIGIENPDYWGKGYGTEVTRLMLRYAFETLGLHRVELRVAAYNTRAIRCYEKCGFRHEGVQRHSFLVDGEWQDDVLMAILRDEWEAKGKDEGGRMEAEGGAVIRSFTLADYDQVIALWQAVGFNVGVISLRSGDRREALHYKLLNDRGPFIVAEADGRIIGTAMASWDGRWAWVNRVAVHPDSRHQGLGRRLMAEVERRLSVLGATAVCLLIGRSHPDARYFYEKLGYEINENVKVMAKAIANKETPT